MNNRASFWDKKQEKNAAKDWIDKPSVFAQWAVQFFPKKAKILELGAGHGQDSRFFASKGFTVVSTDFSKAALQYNKNKLPDPLKKNLAVQTLDLINPFPFDDQSFDAVYAHLSIHYFDNQTTDQVFSELHRVLKPAGIVALLVNSTKDLEYGMGQELEDDLFELEPGDTKRFFSVKTMKDRTKQFKTIVLDEQGTTYKDTAKGVFNLIRYVGQKKIG